MQYFGPAFSNNMYGKPIFRLFESSCFTQVFTALAMLETTQRTILQIIVPPYFVFKSCPFEFFFHILLKTSCMPHYSVTVFKFEYLSLSLKESVSGQDRVLHTIIDIQ